MTSGAIGRHRARSDPAWRATGCSRRTTTDFRDDPESLRSMMNVIRTGIVGAVATLISIIAPAAEATFAGDNGRLAVST